MQQMLMNLGFIQPTSEREMDSVRMAREATPISLPPEVFKMFRHEFEQTAKFSMERKIMDTVGTAALLAAPIALVSIFNHEATPPVFLASLGIISTAWCTAVATLKGRKTQMELEDKILHSKMVYDARVRNHLAFLEAHSINAAKSYFVEAANQSVKSGRTISMEDLAKLVNFEGGYLIDACDKLTITVLQAKMMIAIQDKKVESFVIANSIDAGWPRGTHEDYLALKLWDQMRKLKATSGNDDNNQFVTQQPKPAATRDLSQTASARPDTADIGFGTLVKSFGRALSRYVIDGLKGNKSLYNDPNANTHLPTIPQELNVPAFVTTPDLVDRIKHYGMEYLDLPALAQK